VDTQDEGGGYFEWLREWEPGRVGEMDPERLAVAAAGAPRVNCAAGDGVIPWRELQWEPVVEGGRVVVSAAVPALHRRCRRRAARREFRAWVEAVGRSARIVGPQAGRITRAQVVAWRDFGVAVVVAVEPIAASVVRSGVEVVRVHGEDARRWVRSVPLEGVGRRVGEVVGPVLAFGLDAAAPVVQRLRGVGHGRRRQADHDDPMGSVVAPSEYWRWGFTFDGRGVRGFRINREPPRQWGRTIFDEARFDEYAPAGEAGTARPAAADVAGWVTEFYDWPGQDGPAEFQRRHLAEWFGGDRDAEADPAHHREGDQHGG
jgi:hypothetical protein